MKERPILFSGEMVRAILDGRKTQTRRVIKPQPSGGWKFESPPILGAILPPHPKSGKHGVFVRRGLDSAFPETDLIACPMGEPRDHLWVREAWQKAQSDVRMDGTSPVAYMATDAHPATGYGPHGYKWKSPIFMPRWASRITLEVVGVRVERVQDISRGDAIAEGVLFDPILHSPVKSFWILWDRINAHRGYGWDVNPWVWVVEFKRLA